MTALSLTPQFLKAACLSFLLLCITLTSFTASSPASGPDDYYRDGAARSLSDSLDAMLARIKPLFNNDEFNLTLGVVRNGHVFLKKNYGYSNPATHTPFSAKTQIYLASTSKSLTGTLAAVLDNKGIIKLDGTLAEYLPGFRFNDPNIDPAKITIRSLLTHTHGIKNNDLVVWTAFIGIKNDAQALSLLKTNSTALPNRSFYYSNLGPVIYSLIVERQNGQPWQQVMARQLFKPLGMHATTAYASKVNPKYISYVIDGSEGKATAVFDKADNSMSAAGGHFSTVDDLLKYLQFFLSGGQTVPGLLSTQQIDSATSALVAQKARYQSYERFGYGLGWEQSVFNSEQLTSRLGGYSGLSSHLSYIKQRHMGIVVLSNKKGMEGLAHLVANYLYNCLLNKANKEAILQYNLASLKRNYDDDQAESKEIQAAAQRHIPVSLTYTGSFDGGERSGTMQIDKNGVVRWGNLKGRLHLVTDSTGLINFQTMVRSFAVKKENGHVAGIYSNERYFKR